MYPKQPEIQQQQIYPQQPEIQQQQIYPQQPEIQQQQIYPQQPEIQQQQIYPQQPEIQQQQIYPQQPPIRQQPNQMQPQRLPLHQQQQVQMNSQQYYQGNIGDPSIQSSQSIQPQFPLPTNQHQTPSFSSMPSQRYLVGNLSQPFLFEVAPTSTKVTYLGFNGNALYIIGMGFSRKSQFNYDEQNNRLTILSLDRTTVGSYLAVDDKWRTFTNIISAIDGNSLKRQIDQSICISLLQLHL